MSDEVIIDDVQMQEIFDPVEQDLTKVGVGNGTFSVRRNGSRLEFTGLVTEDGEQVAKTFSIKEEMGEELAGQLVEHYGIVAPDPDPVEPDNEMADTTDTGTFAEPEEDVVEVTDTDEALTGDEDDEE